MTGCGGSFADDDDDYYRQSATACCPRQTIPDSCSCPEGCECMCTDCMCENWGEDGEYWSCGPSLLELDAYGDFAPERRES